MRTVNILDVPVACLDVDGLVSTVVAWAAQKTPRTVSYVNAHCFNLAAVDGAYHDLLSRADLVYADGVSVVWGSRMLGGCRLVKMTGADWIYDFCARAAQERVKCYLLAGRPGIAARAAETLLQRWPELQIIGARDGYFQGKSEAEVLAEIAALEPQVVFVGMGVPRQEKWIAAHRSEIPAPVCWGVGALFDYLAGGERRVPGWMYSLGLEWLWRLSVDPAGKWRRYLLGNPMFVLRILRQKLSS